jgi:hypothetical protein
MNDCKVTVPSLTTIFARADVASYQLPDMSVFGEVMSLSSGRSLTAEEFAQLIFNAVCAQEFQDEIQISETQYMHMFVCLFEDMTPEYRAHLHEVYSGLVHQHIDTLPNENTH